MPNYCRFCGKKNDECICYLERTKQIGSCTDGVSIKMERVVICTRIIRGNMTLKDNRNE